MSYLFRRPLLLIVLSYALVLIIHRVWVGAPVAPDDGILRFVDRGTVEVRGRVVGPPGRSAYGTNYRVRLHSVRQEAWGEVSPARETVVVSLPGRPPEIEWGDEAIFWGRVKPLRGPAAPGAYDERKVLGGRGVHARLLCGSGRGQVLRPAGRASWLWWVVQARRRCLRAFEGLSPPSRAVMAGLLLGRNPAGFPEMKEDFRRSGTIHLLVASGGNVAFVLALWWFLGRWMLFLPRKAVLLFSIPLSFFYAFLAGADAPVMRAAVMSAVGIAGFLLGRVDRTVHSLGAAALALLILEPSALFQAGFQMSFAATLGLLLGLPVLETWAASSLQRLDGTSREVAKRALELLSAGVACQMALAPFLIFYFRRFSVVGIVANLFSVPWASLCLGLGGGLFGADLLGAPRLLLWPTEKASLILWKWSAWVGRCPGAEISTPWNPWQVGLLAAAVIGTFRIFAGGAARRDEEAGRPSIMEGERPPLRKVLRAGAALWSAAALCIVLLRTRRPAGWTILWPRSAGGAAAVLSPGGGATIVNPSSPAEARGTLQPFLRDSSARVRRVLFTRPARRGEEIVSILGGESTAPAPGDAWEEDGAAWRMSPDGALSVVLGGRRVLFYDGRFNGPIAAGRWDVVALRPRGSMGKVERTLARIRAGRFVLLGRGGSAWEKALSPPAHRPSRDGYLVWRSDA